MNKLFTLFGKIERTEDQNPDGIGMGLTICQKIIHNCGGHIDVYSAGANLGSTFMFSIRMCLPKEAKFIAENESLKSFINSQEQPQELSKDLSFNPQQLLDPTSSILPSIDKSKLKMIQQPAPAPDAEKFVEDEISEILADNENSQSSRQFFIDDGNLIANPITKRSCDASDDQARSYQASVVNDSSQTSNQGDQLS